MNQKIFFSYLLSIGICGVSLQAIGPVIAPPTEESYDIQTSEIQPVVLPLLVKCMVDQDGNVTEIVQAERLSKEEIEALYELLHEEDIEANDMSLDNALVLAVSGSAKVLKSVYIIVLVSGKYIIPRVISITKGAWSSLAEKCEEYQIRTRAVNFTKEAWASLTTVWKDYITQPSAGFPGEDELTN